MKPRIRLHSQCGRSARLSLAALGTGLWLVLPDGSAAEPDPAMLPLTELIDEPVRVNELIDRLSPEPEDRRARPPSWMGENFFYQKGVGLEYRRELRMGDHPVELGLQGPLHRKKKRVGLLVEIRF